MANNPKKLTDPTDETLTAIQQVLSVSDEPKVGQTDGHVEAPADRHVDQETPPPDRYEEPAHHYEEPTRSYEAPRASSYGAARAPERDLFEDTAPVQHQVPLSQYGAQEEHQ